MTLDDPPGACATPNGLWYGGGLLRQNCNDKSPGSLILGLCYRLPRLAASSPADSQLALDICILTCILTVNNWVFIQNCPINSLFSNPNSSIRTQYLLNLLLLPHSLAPSLSFNSLYLGSVSSFKSLSFKVGGSGFAEADWLKGSPSTRWLSPNRKTCAIQDGRCARRVRAQQLSFSYNMLSNTALRLCNGRNIVLVPFLCGTLLVLEYIA